MGYEITEITDKYISLKNDYRDELDGFILLIKSIESDVNGRIRQLDSDDIQYIIDGDPYELVFRLGNSFGMQIYFSRPEDCDQVVSMLKAQFEKLTN